MKYTYTANDSLKTWHSWGYTTKKTQHVFGDVHFNAKRQTEHTLVKGTESLVVEPFKEKLGFFERTVGYLPCQDETGNLGSVRIVGIAWNKIVPLIVVLLALIGGGGAYWYQQATAPKPVDKKLITFDAPDGFDNTDPTKISVPTYNIVGIDAKTMKFTTPLFNVAGNKCRMAYKVTLKDDGTVVFDSGDQKLKPGKAWYDFKADTKLKKGSYTIVIKATSYKLKSDTKINSSELEATLVVQ